MAAVSGCANKFIDNNQVRHAIHDANMVESLLKSGFQLPPAPARAALVLRFINSFTIADGACEARSRSDEEGDALSSPTNRDDEIARNPHRPEGLRRNGPVFVVAPRSQ